MGSGTVVLASPRDKRGNAPTKEDAIVRVTVSRFDLFYLQ